MTTKKLELPIPLDELRQILHEYGVVKASIFGSYARGEATPNSDLDLLVQMDDNYSLFDLGGLQYKLSERIPGGVDVATKLHPHFEPYIRPELVEIFSAIT